jgi:hypothetical protein
MLLLSCQIWTKSQYYEIYATANGYLLQKVLLLLSLRQSLQLRSRQI